MTKLLVPRRRLWVVGLILVGLCAPALADDAARKACVDAMNADPSFADSVILIAEQKLADKLNKEQVTKDLCVLRTHEEAADDVAKNERHVILAYGAMWVVAAGLLLFLWRRQQALKGQIAELKRDLDAATRDLLETPPTGETAPKGGDTK